MLHIWLIFAGMLIATSARSASSASGSCASIGYSTSCCPPSEGDNCKATDGDIDCYCNPICHFYGDCCEDVYCPADPKTCADFGITQCCSGSGHCSVYDYYSNDYHCSCNASCHERNDCCPDAQVFCLADSCTGARKYPDCCNRVDASACYVPGGNCYCDPLCTLYHDCCDDADSETHLSQCGSNRFSRMRVQSFQNYKDLNRRRFHNRDQTTYQWRDNAIYQEAPADRVQRKFMNEREFRSRRRMAGQSSA